MKAGWRDKVKLQNYISGTFVEPDSGEWMNDYSPATGEIIGKVPKSNEKNLNTGSCPDALTRYMSEISKIKPL